MELLILVAIVVVSVYVFKKVIRKMCNKKNYEKNLLAYTASFSFAVLAMVLVAVLAQESSKIGVFEVSFLTTLVIGLLYVVFKKEEAFDVVSLTEEQDQTLHKSSDDCSQLVKYDYPIGTPYEIIDMFENQEFDKMRSYLQKIAYEMVGNTHTDEEKQSFKEFMTFFASRDPLYINMLKKLLIIISKNEGILQSKIYPHLPEYDTETIRYVLYFANENKDIKRIKKGRSYQLFTKELDNKLENISGR